MDGKKIFDKLLQEITVGTFSKTAKLPSESALGKRFGVSRMTVRAALAELQRRGLIRKHNGVGSFLTQRALRKSDIIGLVIPDVTRFEFFTAMQNEIAVHCARLNYRIEVITSRETGQEKMVSDIRHKVRKLASLRAEGVIFRPYVSNAFTKANREIVHILQSAGIPVVLVDADITRPPGRSEYDLIAIDNIAAGRRIAAYLHNRKYRRIAFISETSVRKMNANWSNRLFGLAGELALLDNKNAVTTIRCDPEDKTAIGSVMRGKLRPDAIVCGNDEQAAKLLKTLSGLGKRVPRDVAVIGFDDSEHARLSTPGLTTVSQPVGKIAATAFKTLMARIRYPNNEPRETLLAAPLVVRGSA